MLMTVFHLPGSAARAIEEHQAIRAAIAAGDAARARDEMRAHLTRVELDVQKGAEDG
jgi:DNA-binding GntR family transcriptional regulator